MIQSRFITLRFLSPTSDVHSLLHFGISRATPSLMHAHCYKRTSHRAVVALNSCLITSMCWLLYILYEYSMSCECSHCDIIHTVHCEIIGSNGLQTLLTKTSGHTQRFLGKQNSTMIHWFNEWRAKKRYKLLYIKMIHMISSTWVLTLLFFSFSFSFSIVHSSVDGWGGWIIKMTYHKTNRLGHRENLVEKAISTEADAGDAR